MFDPVTLITGAGIFAAGTLLGRIRRAGRQPPVAKCSCGHAMALHDKAADKCHGENSRTRFNKNGEAIGVDWVPCPCRRYVGPEHIADVWAPPPISS